jgi:hypothetical protein
MTFSQRFPALMLPVKAVKLTRGQVAVVDPEDYPTVSQFKWYAGLNRRNWYALRGTRRGGAYQNILMHNFISGFALTDHVNGDGLDNRRVNLRDGSKLNAQNSHSCRGSSSRYKGVSRHKRKDRRDTWHARIWLNGRNVDLGEFREEEDAARAYDAAARRHHGDWGRYNFPEDGERSALRAAEEKL